MRTTYANVASTLALVVAVGTGGAWAASQIDGSTLRDRSVPGKKLRKKTVTRKEIKQATLRSLVQGGGVLRSGHLTGEAGGGPGPGDLLQSTRTPLGEMRLSCATANADARYVNTTAGTADTFRSIIGPADQNPHYDPVPRNGDVGYSATNASGPAFMDMRVGKGTRLLILRVAMSRSGTHCVFDWELVSSG